jgi:hypothetical protein
MRVAVTALLTAVSVASLGAQDTTRIFRDSASVSTRMLYRDPHRAKVLGTILPGTGHIYAGEYLRGYGTWVVTITGIGIGPVVYYLDACSLAFLSLSECRNPGPQWPHRLLGVLMVGSGVWTWISSARDAPHAAERANAKHQTKTLKLAPFIEPSSELGAQWHAGLAVRW